MANIDNGYSVDVLVLGDFDDDQILLTQGNFDPTSVGYEAPVGSMFYRRDIATVYQKIGVGDTAWSSVSEGTTDELVKVSNVDPSAGYLADKILSGSGVTVTTELVGSPPTTSNLIINFTGVDRVQTIYVGKHGNDSDDGFAPEKAKLTFGAAITAATSLTPSGSNKISIVCEDGGTYSESFTIPSYVMIKAPNASFIGNVQISDDSEFVFQKIEASSGNVIQKTSSATGVGWASGEIVEATSNANGLVNIASTSVFIIKVRQIYAENGTCILDLSNGSGHIHVDVEDMYITGTGTGCDRQSNNGIIVGHISHILEEGGGIGNGTALDITNGRMNINVGTIETNIAYIVSGSGQLDMFVNNIPASSQRIQVAGSAEVNVIQSDSLRWKNQSSSFSARRTEFVAIDTSSNPVTMNLPSPASNGDSVTFQDATNTFGTNNLTIDAQTGGVIDDGAGGSQTVVLDISGTAGVLIYNETLGRWTFSRIQEEVAFSPSNLIYVTKNGSDTIGNGSFSNPYLTIKKGVTEASSIATSTNPITVKILDGIYDEINPIVVTNPYVGLQGNSQTETIIRPTVNGQNLFSLTSNIIGEGNTLESMRLRGRDNGGTAYKDVVGSNLIEVIGDGVYNFNQVDANESNHGLSFGSGTITTAQNITWSNSRSTNNFHGLHGAGTNTRLVGMNLTTNNNDVNVHAVDSTKVELNSFRIGGPDPLVSGIGIQAEDTSTVIVNGGLIHNLTDGIIANGSADIQGFSLEMRNNTNDFDQVVGTASINIQGTLSKTKQLITDGTNVSLNYVDSDTGDYIVGTADSTGDPGKEFRVREIDGRVAVGDAATNANMADGAIGGGRSLNVIDSNGNMRIWRYVTDPGQDPALELLKGTALATEGAGRPGGPNPGDPAADITGGTGTVWWDMFLQEDDYLVIRHRTDGGGGLENEKVRIYPDHSEWWGATQYDDSDNATIVYLQTVSNAENYLTITNNTATNAPSLTATGPNDVDIDINIVPKGTGTVLVPVGYEANVTNNSLITKQYFDDNVIQTNIQEDGVAVPNTPHSTINFVNMAATDAGAGVVNVQNVFGSEYYYVESLGITTIDTETFQEKLKLTTGTIPAGTYRIGWSYTYNHNSLSDSGIQRIQVDDTDTLAEYWHEPDYSGQPNYGTTGSSQRFPGSGFANVVLTTGVHTVDLDIASENAGVATSVWDARIEFWRIA